MDLSAVLPRQYEALRPTYTELSQSTARDLILFQSTISFLNDICELKRNPRLIGKHAAYKKRQKPIKSGYRVYQWQAGGDASDHLCSRYVSTIWSSAYAMPVPGDATSMNDSHINCMCDMVYIGMGDKHGNVVGPQDAYTPDDPYAGPQGVAP